MKIKKYWPLAAIFLFSVTRFSGAVSASGDAADFEGEIMNVADLEEGLVGGGLISEQAVLIAGQKGFRTIIDLRTPDEDIFSEQEFVEANGLRYLNIPIEQPGREQAEELRRVLARPDTKPAILHCRSGRRVQEVWAEYRKLGVS